MTLLATPSTHSLSWKPALHDRSRTAPGDVWASCPDAAPLARSGKAPQLSLVGGSRASRASETVTGAER